MKEISVLGVDLAKNIFQVYGADKLGRPVLVKQVKRGALKTLVANLKPCA